MKKARLAVIGIGDWRKTGIRPTSSIPKWVEPSPPCDLNDTLLQNPATQYHDGIGIGYSELLATKRLMEWSPPPVRTRTSL